MADQPRRDPRPPRIPPAGTNVIVALVLLVLVSCLVRRRNEPLGGKWFIQWETSQLAESGGTHPFLHRKTAFGSRRVEENTWRYRYLGDACVLYVAGNSNRRELMAACGEHPPVVIADRMDDEVQGYVGSTGLLGDPININGSPVSVAEIKRKAIKS